MTIDRSEVSRALAKAIAFKNSHLGWTQNPCWGCAWDGVGDIDEHECTDYEEPLRNAEREADADFDYLH
jgi:hypothetical protein